MVDLVNKIGLDRSPLACATVGMMQIHPNSRNVIPGEVFFTVDFRHPDDAVLANMDKALREGVEKIAKDIGLETEFEQIFYYAPVPFDKSCVDAVRKGQSLVVSRHVKSFRVLAMMLATLHRSARRR